MSLYNRLLFLMIFLFKAYPSYAGYSEDYNNIFWFVAIADTHIGENLLGGEKDTKNLSWVLKEMYSIIKPRLVVLCGDIVDNTKGLMIPCCQQHDQEWSEYRQVVDDAGMSPDNYMDIPGNHDAYYDPGLTHYLKYSISGSFDGQTQHSKVDEALFGKYHFLGIATPTKQGEPWPIDPAKIDQEELSFIKLSFAYAEDASLHFVFGHHPPGFEGFEELNQLFKEYKVSAYIYGHTHDYLAEFHDGILWFNVRSLGKSNDKHIAVIVVDNDAISIRAFTVFDLPYVLVTAPTDQKLGGGNPHAYKVPKTWKQAPVRAVVFAKNEPQKVEFQVDKMAWYPMVKVAENIYKGEMDASLLDEDKEHTLTVRALPWPTKGHQITFTLGTYQCSDGLDNDGDGNTDYPSDKGCTNPADDDEFDFVQVVLESVEEICCTEVAEIINKEDELDMEEQETFGHLADIIEEKVTIDGVKEDMMVECEDSQIDQKNGQIDQTEIETGLDISIQGEPKIRAGGACGFASGISYLSMLLLFICFPLIRWRI